MYHSLSFLAYYFLEILVSPTHVFEAPPTLNHLHIIKFRGEDILPSAPVNMFTDITSQPKILGLSEVLLLIQSFPEYQK